MASAKKHTAKGIVVLTTVLLLAALLLNACGDNPQTQQQATQSRRSFEQELVHARTIGTPEAQLQPIIKQAQQLNQTSAPLTLFGSEPVTTYYSNMSQRYMMLTIQLRGLEAKVTQQLDFQANTDLQNFASILAQRQAQGFVAAKNFSN